MTRRIVFAMMLSGALAFLMVPAIKAVPTVSAAEEAKTSIDCPNCKAHTTLTKKGGSVTLEKGHECKTCQGTVAETHTCDKCGKDVLLCPKCKTPIVEKH